MKHYLKTDSILLFVFGWIFLVMGCAAFYYSFVFESQNPFGHMGIITDVFTKDLPNMFNFADFASMWNDHKISLIIFYVFLLGGLALLIINIVWLAKRKKGKETFSAIQFYIGFLALTCFVVLLTYPATNSTFSVKDGAGYVGYALEEASTNVSGSTDWIIVTRFMGPIFGLASVGVFVAGEILEIKYLKAGDFSKPVEESSNHVPARVSTGAVTTVEKTENGSITTIDEDKITVQYINNFSNSVSEDVVRKIVREELETFIKAGDVTPKIEEKKPEIEESKPQPAVFVPTEEPDDDDNTIKAKIVRIPFTERIKKADKALLNQYNELKSYVLAYGVNSRMSNSGDAFRLHTKTYLKITIAGKSLKLYLALNPKDYADSTIPFADASGKRIYEEIPFVFKVKSDLSLRRAKQLIDDAMKADGLTQGEISIRNWAKEL